MLFRTFHGYNPDVKDRVALVTVEQAADRQMYVIRVARGPRRRALSTIAVHGPYEAVEEVTLRFADTVAELREDGYQTGGVPRLLEALAQTGAAGRAQAALRLGWKKAAEAVPRLLELLPQAVDESCSYLDALGMIGDPQALPALREYASRKLLSRRRSAVEALRRLGDSVGLEAAQQRAIERLPMALQVFVTAKTPVASGLSAALAALAPNERGPALDTLYELATPLSLAVVRQQFEQETLAQAHIWRNVKSIWKRAMLRGDFATFAQIYHAVETQGLKNADGIVASVKSGYDGNQKETRIFGWKTRDYLRRAARRYLWDLARYQPEKYVDAAVHVLVRYQSASVAQLGLQWCYLLHRILHTDRTRGYQNEEYKGRHTLRYYDYSEHKPKPSHRRDEAYPELWDEQPRSYLRLLAHGELPLVHEFAVNALRERHPLLIRDASNTELVRMLASSYEPALELALTEIDRRFDPDQPDWEFLLQLLRDERPLARTLGQRWLRLTAHRWLPSVDRLLDFLGLPSQNIRALVIELAAGYLCEQPSLRQQLAERIALLLQAPEETPGAHLGYGEMAREVLSVEMRTLLPVQLLLGWIAQGSAEMKAIAGTLLRRRDDAIAEIGLARLSALAEHEIAAVRHAAHVLLQLSMPHLRGDPSVLFILAESDWEDTRKAALKLLHRLDLEQLGLDGLLGLLDSHRAEVQDAGKELALRTLHQLPTAELVLCLVQHPAPRLRELALQLAVQYLPETRAALTQLRGFCRSALFDTWPSRRVKNLVFDFLTARGLEDAGQAEVAVAILGDVVRMQGHRDRERALEALARIQIAHPEVATTLHIVPGGVA